MGHSQSYDLRNPEKFVEIVDSENPGTVRGVRRISKEHHTDTVYSFDLREDELRERIRKEELRRQGAELESLRIKNEAEHGGIIDAYRTASPTHKEFSHYDQLKHHSPIPMEKLEKLYRLVDINNGECLKFEPVGGNRLYDTVPVEYEQENSGYHRIRDLEVENSTSPVTTEVQSERSVDVHPEVPLERSEEVGRSAIPRYQHAEYQARTFREVPEPARRSVELESSSLPRHSSDGPKRHEILLEKRSVEVPSYVPRRSVEVLEMSSEVGKSTLPRHNHPEYRTGPVTPSETPRRSVEVLEVTERSTELGRSTLPRHNHPEYYPGYTGTSEAPRRSVEVLEVTERSTELGKSTLPRHNHPEYYPGYTGTSETPRRSVEVLDVTERSTELGKSTLPRHNHPEYRTGPVTPSETPRRSVELLESPLPRHNPPEPSQGPKFSSIEHYFSTPAQNAAEILPRHPEVQPHPMPRYVPPMTIPTVPQSPRVTNISEIHAEKRLVVGVTAPPAATVSQSQCGIEYCTHVAVGEEEEHDDEMENVVHLVKDEDLPGNLTSRSRKIMEEKLFYSPYLPTLSLERRPVVGFYDKLP